MTIALESLGVDVTHHSAHTITAELLHGQPLFFEVDGLRGVLKLFARLGARLLARLGFSFLGFFFGATLGIGSGLRGGAGGFFCSLLV